MRCEDLFKDLPTVTLRGRRRKPANSRLTNYVLRELPKDLREYSNGTLSHQEMAGRQQTMLLYEQQRIGGISDIDVARRTQLDLLMLLGGYLLDREQALRNAPPLLLKLLKQNAKQHHIAPRLTYEYIVDVNTEAFLQDHGIRVFSYGKVARIERDFYIGHYFAEKHMKQAYRTLQSIIDDPTLITAEALQIVCAELDKFTQFMAAYARLPHKEYGYFRRFLSPYPDKIKNASGAFMPSPQLFEMLLHPAGYAQTTYVATNMRYFSQWAQPLLGQGQEKAGAGRTIEALLATGEIRPTATEAKILHAIVEQFIQFKLTHIRVVTAKIPEAFPKHPIVEREQLRKFRPFQSAMRDGEGTQQGTGGFAPQDFLGDGINRLLSLQERLLAK